MVTDGRHDDPRCVIAVEGDPTMSVTVSVAHGLIRVKLGRNGFLKGDDFRALYEGAEDGETLSFGSVAGTVHVSRHPQDARRERVAMDIIVQLKATALREAMTVRKRLSPELVDELWLRVSQAEALLATYKSAPGGRRRMPMEHDRESAA